MVGVDYFEIFVYSYYREEDDVFSFVRGYYEEYYSIGNIFKGLLFMFEVIVCSKGQVDYEKEVGYC